MPPRASDVVVATVIWGTVGAARLVAAKTKEQSEGNGQRLRAESGNEGAGERG